MTAPEDRLPVLPNLVIAGVAKAGTTSLFRYLAQHPDVCPSSIKETRYFTPLRYGQPLGPLAEYTRLFEHCSGERYRMEATPGYFAGGTVVAKAVDDLLPDARVVVLLRDPVQRCWSWYRFTKSYAKIPKEMSFAAYLDRCFAMHETGEDLLIENQPYLGILGSLYDAWFDDWSQRFRDRLFIGYFEDLAAQPREATERICAWLGLDTRPCAGFAYHVENRTVQYKNKGLQRAALALNRGAETFFARRPGIKRTMRAAYYRINADTSDERLDPDSRARLTEFFAPHNERLATRLTAAGHDRLPEWLAPTEKVE